MLFLHLSDIFLLVILIRDLIITCSPFYVVWTLLHVLFELKTGSSTILNVIFSLCQNLVILTISSYEIFYSKGCVLEYCYSNVNRTIIFFVRLVLSVHIYCTLSSCSPSPQHTMKKCFFLNKLFIKSLNIKHNDPNLKTTK